MVSFFDNMYIGIKNRMVKGMERFMKEEKGVSSFVATILLILIVVLLVALFWGYIKDWFETTWQKIMGKANEIG